MMVDSIPANHTLMNDNAVRCLNSKTADECEIYSRIVAVTTAEVRQSGLAVDQYLSSKLHRELLALELRQKQYDFEMKLQAAKEAKSPKPNSTDPTDPAAEARS
jgi:hypothetical protein